jgi:hypothetical protein
LQSSPRISTTSAIWVFLSGLILSALPAGNTRSADLLGVYVGGAIGDSNVQINTPSFSEFPDNGVFQENSFGFKVMVGVRPISFLGAELAYIDFGHPNGSLYGQPANASVNGAAAFAVAYLPLPLMDLYAKAGLARLDSTVSGTSTSSYPFCESDCLSTYNFRLSRTNTSGAGGVGAQMKYGAVAVRAEYERFNAAGGNPSLISVGVTWTFL